MLLINNINHRTVVHRDMDCFFVSVSRLNNLKLIGKPVIVGCGDRGTMCFRFGEDKIHRAAALSFSLRGFNPFNGISNSPVKKLKDQENKEQTKQSDFDNGLYVSDDNDLRI